MNGLSVIIIARNEAHNIKDCLQSCGFADEIIVVDDFSEDETVAIAQSMGAVVVQRHLDGDWGAQQTFAMNQASKPWLFLLDADERISEALAMEIQKITRTAPDRAYWVQRQNQFHFNKATHGVLRSDRVLRLMPKAGSYVEGFVHPQIVTPYPTAKLSGALLHFTYDNWEQYFNKFNKYTTLSAKKYQQQGKKCSFFKDILIRPFWAFIKVYLIQGGFLDGKMGWILSVNHYFYTMNKYVKLYTLQKSKGKL